MPTLLLLRHASAADSAADDRERPLTPAGHREARQAATQLVKAARRPELVLVSPARRALETLEAVRERIEPMSLRIEPELYLASPGEILGLVQELPEAIDCALVIAHNPGLAALAAGLPRDTARAMPFPPACLAVLDFDAGGWQDVAPGRARLVDRIQPESSPE